MTTAAPTVGWIHGYSMDSRMWRELWSLMPEVKHVGVDLPLHGRQPDVPMPATMPELAAAVAEQLRPHRLTALVGLSFGSAVALQVALDHPELVANLVLGAPTLAGQPDDPAARAKYVLMMWESLMGADPDRLVRLWMSDPPAIFTGLKRHPTRHEALREIIRDHRFTELRTGAMRRLNETVHTPADLRRLQARLLVLVGSEDMPQFRTNADLLVAHVPRCTRVTYNGLGHLPLLEDPHACLPALRQFLNGLGKDVSVRGDSGPEQPYECTSERATIAGAMGVVTGDGCHRYEWVSGQ